MSSTQPTHQEGTPSPQEATTPVHSSLLLLRFPEELRTTLDSHEPAPKRQTKATRTPQPPPSRPKRWPRVLFGMVIFGLGLFGAMGIGLLELRYRATTHNARVSTLIQRAQTRAEQALTTGTKAEIYKALPRYLTQLEAALRSLHQIQRTLCPTYHQPQTTPQPRHSASTFRKVMREWQRWLWTHLGTSYASLRRELWADSAPLPPPRHAICQRKPKQLLRTLKQKLQDSRNTLLKEARRHLHWYNWCGDTWARWMASPYRKKWLATMRKRPCRRSCQKRNNQASCRRCRERWRRTLGLSSKVFQSYLQASQNERRGRCLTWYNNKSSHLGVFHLGEYFWRVNRALSYTTLLQRYGMCDKSCQAWRQTWGTRIQLTSQDRRGSVYVQLWSSQTPTPSVLLKQIERQAIGQANGNTIWLPAIRPRDLTKARYKKTWYLLHIFDHKSQKRALLPLSPQPGTHLKKTIRLADLRLHNDGRQPVRFPALSPRQFDGKRRLSFVTMRTQSWEPFPDFAHPFCWQASPDAKSTLPWRAAISTYAIGNDARPLPNGRHLFLSHWPRALSFTQSNKELALLVSLPQMKASQTLQAPIAERSTTLWKLSVSPGTQPTHRVITTAKQANTIDLPLKGNANHTLAMRLACQPTPPLILMQIPGTLPPHLIQPPHTKLLHAAKNNTYIALLYRELRPPHKTKLAIYPQGQHTTSRIVTLPHAYQQLRPTQRGFLIAGADHAQPLLKWDESGLHTWLAGRPGVRYLDPIWHPESKRLFVIHHQTIQHTQQQTTFLLSQRIQEGR